MKKGARAIEISNLICPECSNSFSIPRIKNRRREKGHLKTIWCPFCHKEQIMTEYRECDVFKNGHGEIIY